MKISAERECRKSDSSYCNTYSLSSGKASRGGVDKKRLDGSDSALRKILGKD